MAHTKLILTADDAVDLMTSNPTAVHETSPLSEAAAVLARFSAVPVIDHERRIVGVLSRTDVVRAVADPKHVATLAIPQREDETTVAYTPERRVSEVMNPSFVSVGTAASAAEVVSTMNRRQIGRVFVLDDDRRLIGVISSTDVLWSLSAP